MREEEESRLIKDLKKKANSLSRDIRQANAGTNQTQEEGQRGSCGGGALSSGVHL